MLMASLNKTKRPISPNKLSPAKKLKLEDARKYSNPLPILTLSDQSSLSSGVERIRFDGSGPRRGDPTFRHHYGHKVAKRRDALARMGKKVVGNIEGIWL
jgi:hypothetical protein